MEKESMGKVIELGRDKIFTLQQARALLPVIRRSTEEAVTQVESLKKRIEEIDPEPEHRPFYEQELSVIIQRWSDKILKLGCKPKGLWLVDFDNSEGYYCWLYPEEDILHYHPYEGGFDTRTLIV